MQHLGAADAVDDLHAGRVVEGLEGRLRQVLAGRHRAPQPAQLVRLARGQHRPVRGRRRRHDRHAVFGDGVGQLGRGGLLQQQRRRSGPQREQQQRAQAEGEGQRRSAGEEVIRPRPQHQLRVGVARRQQVPVEMHRRLRAAGRPGREGDHRDVVGRGLHAGELCGLGPGQGHQVGVTGPAERHEPDTGNGGQLAGEAVIAERELDPGDRADAGQLRRAQHRHCRDRDAAGLQHAEPAGGEPRVVRPAQQHAVAGHQPEVLGEHPGDLAGAGGEVAVGPRLLR